MAVCKALKLCAVKDIAHIGGHKIAHHLNGNYSGNTDEEQCNILRGIPVASHIPGGKPALVPENSTIQTLHSPRGQIGKRGTNRMAEAMRPSREKPPAG